MTDLTITKVGDAYTNDDRPSTNYGGGTWVRMRSGQMRGYLLPTLPNIAGRTVTAASFLGHASRALVGQTITLHLITERWTPGRVTQENQPDVDSGSGVAVTISSTPIGGVVEWPDVIAHLQAVADGTEWFGWRVTTGSTAADQAFWATDSGEPAWELSLSLSDAVDQPTDLKPDGGDVEDLDVLSWEYDDRGLDSSAQAQSKVQVDTPTGGADPDEVSPDYDSGYVSNPLPQYDISAAHSVTGAGPHFWRVRLKDADGNETSWSDWAEVGKVAMPSLVVDSPTGPFGDPTPTIAAHLSSGTVASWESFVTGADRSDVRHQTGVRTGAISYEPPLNATNGRRVLVDDVPGWAYLRVYPVGNWVTAVGRPNYLETWIELDWDEDAGVDAPTNLTVVPLAPGDARHVWTWDRVEAADAWLPQVDDVSIARLEDVEVSGGTYTWTDNGQISPLRTHTLGIRAVEGDQRSEADTVTGYSYTASGVWLLPEAEGIAPVQLAGTGVSGFTRVDQRATYVTLTGDEVDVIYGTPGRSATYEGFTYKGAYGWTAETVWAAFDTMEALRSSQNRMAQLVWGSQSARVRVRDPDATSSDEILPNNLQHTIRFGFVEALG